MEHGPAELQADFEAWVRDPASSRIPDIEKIAPMVVPLRSDPKGREHVYTCKHLASNGDCLIYETRPQMCRDFPGQEGCHFRGCKSDRSAYFGMGWWRRAVTRFRWLKGLSGRARRPGS